MSLYEKETLEIDQAISKCVAENPDSELTPEIVNQILSNIECDIKLKMENICKYIKKLEHDINFADWEIERIADFKKKASNKIEGLKSYILPYILEKGKQQVGTFSLSNRKSYKVIILDDLAIGDEFKQVSTVTKINKAALKKRLQESDSIQGAELVQNNNLQIK